MKPVTESIIALAVLAGVFVAGYQVSSHSWQAKWSARDAADSESARVFNDEQRRIEQQRQGAIDAIQRDADAATAKAKNDAARAAAESERLRGGISDAIARLRSGGGDTGAAASSTARDRTGILLAELFREIDTAAGEYAAEADRRGRAGLMCERAWDAMRGGKR